MIIPDEKKTMYPLVSILITQMYTSLVECANENEHTLEELFFDVTKGDKKDE